MKLIVTGGRDFHDYDFMNACLRENYFRNLPAYNSIVGIHGNADGADKLFDRICKEYGIPVVPFPATPEMWNLMENQAGNVRNRQMLLGNPEAIVAAFPGPKSRGTFNCMNDAARMGMRVDLFRNGFADQLNWSKKR